MKRGKKNQTQKKVRCSEVFTDTPQIFSGGFLQCLLLVNYPMFKASEVSVNFWLHNSWEQPKIL